eukprot:c47330_g1_i1 orf=328-1137(+)
MYTVQCSLAAIQNSRISSCFTDLDLLGDVRVVARRTKRQMFGGIPIWKVPSGRESLKIYGTHGEKNLDFERASQQIRRLEPMMKLQLQYTSRRRGLFTLPMVLEFSSVYTRLCPAQAIGEKLEAGGDDVPVYGSGMRQKDRVIQGSPFTTRVERPQRDLAQPQLEEVLTVQLKLLRNKFCGFNLFINCPTATVDTSVTSKNFAGSYFHEAEIVKNRDQKYQVTLFRIGIGDTIKGLGVENQSSILISFVPTGPNKDLPMIIQGICIDLE